MSEERCEQWAENGLTVRTENAMTELASRAAGMEGLLRMMAEQLRITGEKMERLEREVRLLTKVSGAQANEINRRMRERAAELSAEYRMPDRSADVLRELRRSIRLQTGFTSSRECPAVEYDVTLQRIALWEDRKALKAIRDRGV